MFLRGLFQKIIFQYQMMKNKTIKYRQNWISFDWKNKNQSPTKKAWRKEERREKAGVVFQTEERSDLEEDSPRDDYKIEVVRRLMKGFSLNETVAYYRNLNSAEYAINPNNFSLDRYVCILYVCR